MFYLDGVANGYVIELGTGSGNAGLLEAQYTPPGGTYPDTLLGFFVAGTQFAQTAGPISLVPSYTLSFGTLSGTYSSGQFDVDTAPVAASAPSADRVGRNPLRCTWYRPPRWTS